MKSIKLFQYKNTNAFKRFLSAYGYKLENVKGFSFAGKKQHRYNVLKLYNIRFNDGEYEYFKVVYFKDFNEYQQARLSFSDIKLSGWYSSADIRKYKLNEKNEYVTKC